MIKCNYIFLVTGPVTGIIKSKESTEFQGDQRPYPQRNPAPV